MLSWFAKRRVFTHRTKQHSSTDKDWMKDLDASRVCSREILVKLTADKVGRCSLMLDTHSNYCWLNENLVTSETDISIAAYTKSSFFNKVHTRMFRNRRMSRLSWDSTLHTSLKWPSFSIFCIWARNWYFIPLYPGRLSNSTYMDWLVEFCNIRSHLALINMFIRQ